MSDTNEHPLATFRRARGLSQEALGHAVGTTKATISRIEARVHSPSMALVGELVTFADGDLSGDDFLPEVRERVRA